jgi:hypothetical protein
MTPPFFFPQDFLATQVFYSFTQILVFFPISLKNAIGIFVRKMIFSIKVFVTLLGYSKTPQVTILGDLHV